MPYTITRGSGQRPWKIRRYGVTVGSAKTKKDAEASVRAREAGSHKKSSLRIPRQKAKKKNG